MRSRTLAVAGLSAAALAAATTFAGTAGAASHSLASFHHTSGVHTTAAAKGSCYRLTKDDTGDGIVSANFSDAGDDIYNSAGAADFKVKKKCAIGSVSTVGAYFNGAGPADSVNVIIYNPGKKNTPGKVKTEQDNLKYKDASGTGSLDPTLKKTIKLTKGTYWVSVVANMTFATGGEWGWDASSDTVGATDQWENPNGGFGACTKWGNTTDCIGTAVGDYIVTLAAGS